MMSSEDGESRAGPGSGSFAGRRLEGTVYTGDSREVTAELSIGISTTDIYYLLR